jgi:hypothetical protein
MGESLCDPQGHQAEDQKGQTEASAHSERGRRLPFAKDSHGRIPVDVETAGRRTGAGSDRRGRPRWALERQYDIKWRVCDREGPNGDPDGAEHMVGQLRQSQGDVGMVGSMGQMLAAIAVMVMGVRMAVSMGMVGCRQRRGMARPGPPPERRTGEAKQQGQHQTNQSSC